MFSVFKNENKGTEKTTDNVVALNILLQHFDPHETSHRNKNIRIDKLTNSPFVIDHGRKSFVMCVSVVVCVTVVVQVLPRMPDTTAHVTEELGSPFS